MQNKLCLFDVNHTYLDPEKCKVINFDIIARIYFTKSQKKGNFATDNELFTVITQWHEKGTNCYAWKFFLASLLLIYKMKLTTHGNTDATLFYRLKYEDPIYRILLQNTFLIITELLRNKYLFIYLRLIGYT